MKMNLSLMLVVVICITSFCMGTLSSLLRNSQKKQKDVACCDSSCKIAICVPPWTSVCLRCGDTSSNNNNGKLIADGPTSKPTTGGYCCPSKCQFKLCIEPFAEVCVGCNDDVEEVNQIVSPLQPIIHIEGVRRELETLSKEKCCDGKCEIAVCVPEFYISVCLGCSKEIEEERNAQLLLPNFETSAVVVAQEEVKSMNSPYKQCCSTMGRKNCQTQICVPPFVTLCFQCEGDN